MKQLDVFGAEVPIPTGPEEGYILRMCFKVAMMLMAKKLHK